MLSSLDVYSKEQEGEGKMEAMPAPLDGFMVVDLTQGESGPTCGMLLGDAGADVIKVEPLEGDWARQLGPPFVDGDSGFFMGLNRNKRSIALDMNHPQGREVILKLAEKADVFIESFRPGLIDQMGLGYETLNRINPKLIFCSISPYDQTGPYAQKAASDLVLQGIAGFHRFHGVIGQDPIKIGFNFASVVADHYACQAIVAAVFWRYRSGLGQKVETSMIRAMLLSEHNHITSDSDPDEATANTGFNISHLAPPNTGVMTKDIPITFGFTRTRDKDAWEKFCRSVGMSEEVINDPRFNTEEKRRANDELLKPYYEEAFKDKPAAEVLKLLDAVDAVCAPMHNYETLFKDPYVEAQEMKLEMNHATAGKMNTFGLAWKLTGSPGSVRLAPPKIGQHTLEILSSLGYSVEAAKDLVARRIAKAWSEK